MKMTASEFENKIVRRVANSEFTRYLLNSRGVSLGDDDLHLGLMVLRFGERNHRFPETLHQQLTVEFGFLRQPHRETERGEYTIFFWEIERDTQKEREKR